MQNEFNLKKRIAEDPQFRKEFAMNTLETLNNQGYSLTQKDIVGLDLDLDFKNLSPEKIKEMIEKDLKCIGVNTVIICTFKENEIL